MQLPKEIDEEDIDVPPSYDQSAFIGRPSEPQSREQHQFTNDVANSVVPSASVMTTNLDNVEQQNQALQAFEFLHDQSPSRSEPSPSQSTPVISEPSTNSAFITQVPNIPRGSIYR